MRIKNTTLAILWPIIFVGSVALAAAGDRYFSNPTLNKDVVIQVNKAGVTTDALKVTGSTGTVTVRGRTDGLSPASGDIGEIALGSASLRAGTGGFTYSVRSTTGWTTTPSTLISTTLNKGSYLVTLSLSATALATTYISGQLTVGGVNLTPQGLQGLITTTAGPSMHITIPIVISTDATVVAGVGVVGAGSTAGSHEMWIVRM
jgi:hypothetical protein